MRTASFTYCPESTVEIVRPIESLDIERRAERMSQPQWDDRMPAFIGRETARDRAIASGKALHRLNVAIRKGHFGQ